MRWLFLALILCLSMPRSALAETSLGYSRDKIWEKWQALDMIFKITTNYEGSANLIQGSFPEDHVGNVQLNVYSQGDDVYKIDLDALVSPTNPQATLLNMMCLSGLVKYLFPDWEEGTSWTTDAGAELLKEARTGGSRSRITVVRITPAGVEAEVTLRFFPILSSYSLFVEAKD